MVVIGPDIDGAIANKQIFNVGNADKLRLKVTFDEPSVDVTVMALELKDGEPKEFPRDRDESTRKTGFLAGQRTLRPDDPDMVFFILQER